MTEFRNVQPGLLEEGTETTLGTIDAVSLTAYRIGGEWVPFYRIHGRPAPAEPLVRLEW